jgi:hypothetical protein
MKGLAMLDGVLKISQPNNSTLATVHLCRDEIEVKMNMREHDRNRTQHLNLFIDYYENRDEEGFVVSRKLDTVCFIFDLKTQSKKFDYERSAFIDQFFTTDKAKDMFSGTFPNSPQDVVDGVFRTLKHFIRGQCDLKKISM